MNIIITLFFLASALDGVDDWRSGGGARPGGDEFGGGRSRPRLNLAPRTKPVEGGQSDEKEKSAAPKKANPFGSAAPVDIDAKMRNRVEGGGNRADSGDKADNWRNSGGGARDRVNKSGNNLSSWRDRSDSENNTFASNRSKKGGGRDASDRDFANLRSNSKEDEVVEEEGGDGWLKVSMGGKKDNNNRNKGRLEQVKEETSPNKGGNGMSNRFQAMPESDSDSEADKKSPKGKDSDEEEEGSDDDGTEEDEKSESRQVSKSEERSHEEPEMLKKDNKNDSVKSGVSVTLSSRPAGAGGKYVSPAVARRMQEEEERNAKLQAEKEERDARIAKGREEREKKQAEERALKEIEMAKQKKIDDARAQVEAQKKEREQQGLEDAIDIQKAALEIKQRQKEAQAQKKTFMAFNASRFTKAHSNELVRPMDDLLSKQFGSDGSGLVLDDYDVAKWFGEEMCKNIYFAILLVVRRILHNSTSEKALVKGLKNSTPLLKKLLCDGGLEKTPQEVLYAAVQVVANEMRHPGTKQLPDFGADSGVIECFFYECYHTKFLSEENIIAWFDDVDDETNGMRYLSNYINGWYCRPALRGSENIHCCRGST